MGRKTKLALWGGTLAALIAIYGVLSPPPDTIRRARETVLRQDLYDLRRLIAEYTRDKQRPPASLQELVTSGYLKPIPKDPITGREDTWVVEASTDPKLPGIIDVHSGSRQISSKGDPYSAW